MPLARVMPRLTCCICLHRFDPLSLASEEKALTWFQQAELVHSRTAMAAVAGIIIPGVSLKELITVQVSV